MTQKLNHGVSPKFEENKVMRLSKCHPPLISGVRARIGLAACSSIHHATSAREIAAVIEKLSTILTRRVSGPEVSRVGRGQHQSSSESANTRSIAARSR